MSMLKNQTLQNLDLSDRPPMRLVVWGTAEIADVWPPETTEPIRADGLPRDRSTDQDQARIAS